MECRTSLKLYVNLLENNIILTNEETKKTSEVPGMDFDYTNPWAMFFPWQHMNWFLIVEDSSTGAKIAKFHENNKKIYWWDLTKGTPPEEVPGAAIGQENILSISGSKGALKVKMMRYKPTGESEEK